MINKPYSRTGSGKRANLIRARLSEGMSQEQVAAQIGCSRELYSQIENGRRDGRTIGLAEKLEMLFDIPKEYLMLTSNEVETFDQFVMKRFTEVK